MDNIRKTGPHVPIIPDNFPALEVVGRDAMLTECQMREGVVDGVGRGEGRGEGTTPC